MRRQLKDPLLCGLCVLCALARNRFFLRSSLHISLRPKLNSAVDRAKSCGALTTIDDETIVLIPTIRILNDFLMSSLHPA